MVLIGALLSMVIAMAMLPPLTVLARRVGILALPESRKVHVGEVPQIGGVAIMTGAVFGATLLLPPTQAYLTYLAGAGAVFLIGLFDDYHALGHRSKFAVQYVAAGIAVVGGGLAMVSFNSPLGMLPAWLGGPLAVIALVQITNAVNLADGLDGLAGGLCLLSCLALAICGYQVGDAQAMVIALMIAGSVIGFLRFNTHPARVFMGDNGAYFLGFSLGVIALGMSANAVEPMSFTATVMLLGVPVLDALFVPFYRAALRKPLFVADRNHLHHRLLHAGFSHRSAVAMMYAFHSALLMVGYALRSAPEWILLPTFGMLATLIECSPAWVVPLQRWLKNHTTSIRPSGWLGHALDIAAWLALLGSILVATASAQSISVDFVAGSLVALLALGVSQSLRRDRGLGWADRCALYVLGAYTVYFGEIANPLGAATDLVLFVTIGGWFVYRLVADRALGFALTPLDLIVVVATGAIALVGREHFEALTLDVVKLVVWFYAIELLAADPARANWLRGLGYLGLALISARGLMGLE